MVGKVERMKLKTWLDHNRRWERGHRHLQIFKRWNCQG